MLRASFKSEGLKAMFSEIQENATTGGEFSDLVKSKLSEISTSAEAIDNLERDEMELTAKHTFNELTTLYQLVICIQETTDNNKAWMNPTKKYLALQLEGKKTDFLLSKTEIDGLIGWEI